MPPSQADLARYRAVVGRHRTRASRELARLFVTLGSWDEADVARFVVLADPRLVGVHSATVNTTSAFLSRVLDIAPVGVDPAAVEVDVDPRRPFTTYWHALGEGHAHEEALRQGTAVAEAVAEEFVQSTTRRTGDAFQQASGERFRWRRVAEPGACRWCLDRDGGIYVSAADGDYGHNRCKCDVVPDV